jgi:ABC-2 type transport system ATP-binding protein
MNVLEFQGIHRAFRRGHDVLEGVGFALQPGEVVGLLGKNGAGKTTLIRIAMGMIEAQAGTVRLFGLDPREHAVEIKRRVGYVSEEQILPEFMSVAQVVRLHRELFPTWDDEVARSLLERFELSPRARIRTLSKGQARQVALICAVAHKPELLLLDEPAGGLDPAARREFLETSIELLNAEGTTILFSSHYMSDVERMAARVVMLHDGKLLLDSELDSLREDYCLALVPRGVDGLPERLFSDDRCVGGRERSEALHAIFRANPQECGAYLERKLGIRGARCATVPLEEIFVTLAGGDA